MRRLSALICTLALTTFACDGGGETTNPEEPVDEELGDKQLTGQGPGGIGEVTAGMADADPKVVEAEALIAQGKYARALETIEAAIAEKPEYARFHYVRGNALSHLDRDPEAREAYAKALELDPGDPMPHAALGALQAFSQGASKADKAEAIEHFQAALKLDPEFAVAHQQLGVILLDLGRLQEAVEALENADRLAGSVDTAYTLAQIHARLGNDEKGLEYARSALEYEPNASGADIRLLYARMLMKAGKDDEAAREFEQVAKLVPESAPLRLEVVRGLYDLGRYDAAMVHMQWLVDTLPTAGPVLVNHGRLLVAMGKPKQAITEFDKAIDAAPESHAARVYRIEALVAAKQCKQAKQALAKLRELPVEDGDAKAQRSKDKSIAKAKGYLKAGKCK